MINYVGQIIKVELTNKFYYKGEVIEETEDFIFLRDKVGKRVQINKNSIMCLEVLDD